VKNMPPANKECPNHHGFNRHKQSLLSQNRANRNSSLTSDDAILNVRSKERKLIEEGIHLMGLTFLKMKDIWKSNSISATRRKPIQPYLIFGCIKMNRTEPCLLFKSNILSIPLS
jgi:hypothetical protein